MSDLDTTLIDVNAPADLTDETRESWTPADLAAADWVGRKAVRARTELLAVEQQAERLIEQARAWCERESARAQQTLGWAEAMLRVYLDREVAADTSKKPRKSRSLPCGVTVAVTAGRETVTVTDEPALVSWLQENRPDLVEFVPKFSKTEIKKAAQAAGERLVDPSGEVVPGVQVAAGSPSYRLSFGGDV